MARGVLVFAAALALVSAAEAFVPARCDAPRVRLRAATCAALAAGDGSNWRAGQGMGWQIANAEENHAATASSPSGSDATAPMFLVELSQGWDGAKQELATAQAAILAACPSAEIKVSWHGSPTVRISALDWTRADPAYLMCLPAPDRWRMVPTVSLFEAPQMELYSKYPDLRAAAMREIERACSQPRA